MVHPQPGRAWSIAPVLALICTSVFAYGLSGPDIGWISDDYVEVYGVTSPVPDWWSAFTSSADGHWSPWRLLKHPVQGYLGFWLGPGPTHVLQFVGHLACVLLFYRLLKRLAWPTPASLAAGLLFSSFPWFAEAVYWWPGASANWATALVLVSALSFTRWTESHQRRWLVAYACFVLLSLLTYEIWLGGALFFVALDWYHRRVNGRALKTRWICRYGAIAAPFLIYVVLFAIAVEPALYSGLEPPDGADRVSARLGDLPFAFILVQWRTIQWLMDVQWRWTWLAEAQALHSAPGMLALGAEVAVLVLLSLGWVRGSLRGTGLPSAIAQARVPVWESLILGWSLLLGSRIALILQQSISRFDTRLAYGASLGIAVAAVALVSGVVQHPRVGVRVRAATGVVVLAGVLVLGWASAGVGAHYVKTTQAEAQTIRTLETWVASSPSPPHGVTIVVVAPRSAIAQGAKDLAYFNERDGDWLDYVVKRRCPDCDTYVAEHVDCVGTKNIIAVHEAAATDRTQAVSDGRVTLGDQTVFFRWTGQELRPAGGACGQG